MDIAIGKAASVVPERETSGRRALLWVVAALLATLVMQLPLVLNRAINWDEFFHYSQVVKLANGTLTEPLQTLYTRAFVWVPGLPGLGVDHVIIIRLFMLACELVTLACIASMAARFTNRTTGLLCALAYLSASFIFRHGTSFRFDPPATALLMTSAWILLRWGLRTPAMLAAAILAGTSAILTVKTVLYAPVFAGIAWLLWTEGGRKREDMLRLLALAVGVILCAALIYGLHAGTLGKESSDEARNLMTRAGSSMFRLGNPLYFWFTAIFALTSPILTLAALAAPVAIWCTGGSKERKIALTAMWLPLATLFFYQNTAPYYYVFMMAPVAVAASPALALASRRIGAGIIALAMVVCAGAVLAGEPDNSIHRQRQIQREAQRLFPGGVAYFDSCAMLGAFPKANAFMTPWGVEHYLAGNLPSMEDAMVRTPVPLLVDNDWMFDDAMNSRKEVRVFLPLDLAAIRNSYVHLWGPFWVAGKSVGVGSTTWQVQVPGPYTAENGAMIIDGRRVAKGGVVMLDRGSHVLRAEKGSARLLWGDRLATPVTPAPEKPYFMPF